VASRRFFSIHTYNIILCQLLASICFVSSSGNYWQLNCRISAAKGEIVDSSKLLRAIESDSARHERELTVVKEPHARSAARAQATKFASAGLTTIDQLSHNQCSDYTRRVREWFGSNPDGAVPHPVAEHERTARLGRWGTKLLMGFEVVFAAWITATFNFAQHLWTAMAATAGLWLAASTGLAQFVAMLLKRRAEVPQETRNRIHKAVRVCVIVWLAAAAMILIMRTAQGKTALVLAHATTYVLAAWAIDTILLAGCGIGADRLFRWSGDATREYYGSARTRNRLLQLLEHCSSDTYEADPRSSSVMNAAKLAVGVLAVSLAFGATAKAQTAPKLSPQRGCTYVDETTSVEAPALQLALEQHKQVIQALAAHSALKSWCFVPFTANAWSALPAATVEVPAESQDACTTPPKGEADALFRGAREEHLKQSEQKCEAAKARSAQKLEQDLIQVITGMASSGGESAHCSSVLDALDRAAHTPDLSYAVIVTDGQENCGIWRTVEAPQRPMRAVVVLLPSAGDEHEKKSPAISFRQRKAALLRSAPWLSGVVPPWAFTPDALVATESNLQANSGK
jgi:hypothetical protein